MIGQAKQPEKGKSKWTYAYIPASLSLGILLGWTLSHFITKKAVVNNKNIAEKSGSTLDKVREAILAIDNELSAAKNAEDRKVLVEAAYSLRDLELRKQAQEPLDPSTLKHVHRNWLAIVPDKIFHQDKRFWCMYPNFKG
jgi:hypothetical protein